MDALLALYAIIVTVLFLLYVFFDVNYFLRIAFTIGFGRFFDRKIKIDEHTEIYGKETFAALIYLILPCFLSRI